MTRLTVAICTWNRASTLERALDRVAQLVLPPDVSWEVVVVDNGSTDRTPEVLAAFADRLPLRGVVEPTPGLSHARNAAVRAATGDYILWTDDDALVDRQWLSAYAAAFRRWPDAALFGGPIEPEFEGTPPDWLLQALDSLGNAYALLDLGPSPRPLGAEALPFGANYAIATGVQRRFPYDPRLGRVRGQLFAGEETAVASAVLADRSGWWVPEARVRHLIPPSRQTIDYLREYYLGNAHSGAWVAVTADPDVTFLFGRPRWIWRQAFENELLYHFHRLTGAPPSLWGRELRMATAAWGLLRAIDAPLVRAARAAEAGRAARRHDVPNGSDGAAARGEESPEP